MGFLSHNPKNKIKSLSWASHTHLSSAVVSGAMEVRRTSWKAGPYSMPVRPTAL